MLLNIFLYFNVKKKSIINIITSEIFLSIATFTIVKASIRYRSKSPTIWVIAPDIVAIFICLNLSMATNVGHPNIATGKLITNIGSKILKIEAAI